MAIEGMVVWHGVLVHCFSIAWLVYIRCWISCVGTRQKSAGVLHFDLGGVLV